MKPIQFISGSCQRVYQDYIDRCKRIIHILSDQDREDCLMEINSYVHEYMQDHQQDDEMNSLLNILDRLGPPETTLKEIVASKKIDQAVKTYHIKYLLQALILNLRNGVTYILLFLLTILVLIFPVLIVGKIIWPQQIGLWIGGGSFVFGMHDPENSASHELLGNYFIPVVLLIMITLYFLIIQLLKIVKSKKS